MRFLNRARGRSQRRLIRGSGRGGSRSNSPCRRLASRSRYLSCCINRFISGFTGGYSGPLRQRSNLRISYYGTEGSCSPR